MKSLMPRAAMLFATALAVALTFSACGGAPPPQAPENLANRIVTVDPAFGGGMFLRSRMLGSPMHETVADEDELQAFLARERVVHDEQARALAARCLPATTARAGLRFLETEAGSTFAAAELLSATLYAYFDGAFVGAAAERFGDPAKVGPAAVAEFQMARAAAAEGRSVSPSQLAMTIGAMKVSPEHAAAIAQFCRSERGAEWLAARTQAFEDTQQRFLAFRHDAQEQGLIKSKLELSDLVLPRAESLEPEGANRR